MELKIANSFKSFFLLSFFFFQLSLIINISEKMQNLKNKINCGANFLKFNAASKVVSVKKQCYRLVTPNAISNVAHSATEGKKIHTKYILCGSCIKLKYQTSRLHGTITHDTFTEIWSKQDCASCTQLCCAT